MVLRGAVEIDGKTYRVKTTMNEYMDENKVNNPHSYEVDEIELVDDYSPTNTRSSIDGKNRSIEATKLLQGVEKSYDSGKKLLDESTKTTENYRK